MHLEFQPADAPDPDAQFSVAPEQITTELLELCEDFLHQASPIVRTELRQFLTEHGHHGGLGWLLDALSFTTFNHTPAGRTRPSRSPRWRSWAWRLVRWCLEGSRPPGPRSWGSGNYLTLLMMFFIVSDKVFSIFDKAVRSCEKLSCRS
jgi:hypothetical protein